MDAITPKENIFRRIREALVSAPMGASRSVDLESSVYPEAKGDLAVLFAEKFIAKGGRIVYCEDIEMILQSLQELVRMHAWDGRIFCVDEDIRSLLEFASIEYGCRPVEAALKDVGFCACRWLLASEGSVVFDSSQNGRRVLAQAGTLVFFATVGQIVPDMHHALKQLKGIPKCSSLSVWTGLSCFGDIDGDVLPGLGPQDMYMVLIDGSLE